MTFTIPILLQPGFHPNQSQKILMTLSLPNPKSFIKSSYYLILKSWSQNICNCWPLGHNLLNFSSPSVLPASLLFPSACFSPLSAHKMCLKMHPWPSAFISVALCQILSPNMFFFFSLSLGLGHHPYAFGSQKSNFPAFETARSHFQLQWN